MSRDPIVQANIGVEDHEKRCNISAPFDFHHLTHTQRRQLPALNKSSVADLAAEFQAVQESQLPRKELDGIRVKDLHFASFSSEVLVQDQSEDVNSSFARVLSPPPSPLQSFHPIGQTSSPSTHSSRHTRSIDSLASSEHKTSSRKSSIPPITPPPRTLSQAVLTRLSDLSVLHMPTSVSSSRCSSRRESRSRDSSLWSHTGEAAATPETTCSTASDPFATNHNGTTIPALISRATSPFPNTGGLENVPEEPEGHHSQRLGAGLVALGSPLRHARSFPVSALARNDPSLPAPSASRTNVRLRPKASDTLGTPIKTPSRKSSPRRISRAFKLLESSWEDDVEYCYELAAEADCDFDWDNTSRSGCDDSEGDLPSTTHKQDFAESPSFNRGTVLQARREKEVAESDGSPLSNTLHEQISSPDSVSNRESVPELDRQSAHSTSTVGTGVFTPDVFSSAAPPVGYEVFKARPLPAVPQTPHREVTRLNVYDDLLDDYVTAIQLRPSLEGDRDVSALARPSLTKSSSHDSRLGGASFTSAKGIQRPISSASNIAVRVQEHRSQPVLNRAIIASVEEATSRAQQNQGASIGEAPLWARKTLEAMPLWARDTPSPTVPAVITTSSSASSSFEDLSTRKRIDLSARLSKPLPPTPPQSPTSERSVNPLGQARPKRARQRTHTLSLFPAPLRVRRS